MSCTVDGVQAKKDTECGITSSFYAQYANAVDAGSKQAYIASCKQCDLLRDSDAYKNDCYRASNDVLAAKYGGNSTGSGSLVTPQSGFDYDYSRAVENQFSPRATGATATGTISNVFANAQRLSNVVAGTLLYPIPEDAAPCKNGPQGQGCRLAQSIRSSASPALSDNKGPYASSYSIHVGYCPRSDKTTKTDCQAAGFLWSDVLGACQSKRYAFIDNSPKSFIDGSKMKGLLPTIAADMKVFSPENTYAALMGESIDDAYRLDPCPVPPPPPATETVETFSSSSSSVIVEGYVIVIGGSLLLMFLIYILIVHLNIFE
jgi:hypothetical protein